MMSGLSVSPASDSRTRRGVAPPAMARWAAAWSTGPSAMGSEWGRPSSMASSPRALASESSPGKASREGSPAMMKGRSGFRLMSNPQTRLVGGQVLVAAATEAKEDRGDAFRGEGRKQSQGMAALQGRQDALQFAKHPGAGERLLV